MLSLPIVFSPLFIDPLFDLVFVSHASYCCIDANVTCDQVPEERTHERARKSPVAWIHDALVRVERERTTRQPAIRLACLGFRASVLIGSQIAARLPRYSHETPNK